MFSQKNTPKTRFTNALFRFGKSPHKSGRHRYQIGKTDFKTPLFSRFFVNQIAKTTTAVKKTEKTDTIEAAKVLYFKGWAQNRIADTLRTSEQTISKWKTDGKWEQNRNDYANTKQTVRERIWKIVNYNLEHLEFLVEENLNLPHQERVIIGKTEADAFAKLLAQVKEEISTWDTYVAIMDEFAKYLELHHLEAAKLTLPQMNEFLGHKRREIGSDK